MFRGVPPGSYTVIITNDCGEHFPLKNILNHYWNSSGIIIIVCMQHLYSYFHLQECLQLLRIPVVYLR